MCFRGLSGLVCGIDYDDDKSHSRGIGKAKIRVRVRFILKATESFSWKQRREPMDPVEREQKQKKNDYR